jgi:hypothetical protein
MSPGARMCSTLPVCVDDMAMVRVLISKCVPIWFSPGPEVLWCWCHYIVNLGAALQLATIQ